MLFDADFTVNEVPALDARGCESCASRGAVPPLAWEREGVGKGLERTRFFKLNSQGNPSVNGVYCEPCLVVARAMSRVDAGPNRRR